MRAQDISKVICPPAAERDRTLILQEAAIVKPPILSQRLRNPIGALLPDSEIVRANFFRVNTDRVPQRLFKYAVHIYSTNVDGTDKEEVSQKEDERFTTSLIKKLCTRHPEWQHIGFGYDGRSMLMTSASLNLPDLQSDRLPYISESVGLPARATGEESTRKRYRIALTEVCDTVVPASGDVAWRNIDQNILQNLDVNLTSFIRFMQNEDRPNWSLVGSKIFATRGVSAPLQGAFITKCGYYSTLKSCLAGLVLNVDISVNVFVDSGPLIHILCSAVNCSLDKFNALCGWGPLPSDVMENLVKAVKSIKIRTMHTGFDKKVVDVGPAADSPESRFDHNGREVTVAQYFELMCQDRSKPIYRIALPQGKLKYPKLPTINIGSRSRPILVPAELCMVITPQPRNNVVTPEMTAKIVRVAAMRPNDRMQQIVHGQPGSESDQSGSESIVSVLCRDGNNERMGLNSIDRAPMAVAAYLLPPAELQYLGANNKVNPQLRGDWKMEGKKFYGPALGATGGKYNYSVLLVTDRKPTIPDLHAKVQEFQTELEKWGSQAGLSLQCGGAPSQDLHYGDRILEELSRLKQYSVTIVICVMLSEGLHGPIKMASDSLGLLTQCVKWKTIEKNPSGLFTNLLVKMNTKLGGTNHALVSRAAPGGSTSSTSASRQFQDPPSSIAWVMDKPCMLLGIDVSHPEAGSMKPSMAAIVASMDGRLSQYCAQISAQASRQEMVSSLEDAVVTLLETFKARNQNRFPETIVVYRDGVSAGQYDQVLQLELPKIHGALERLGFIPNTHTKVAIVICQKRHHTRLVCEDKANGNAYVNPCPGLVVDARGEDRSIVSGALNEFYLNSHIAIQGTCKPCKYTLIYDEVGFHLSELELLTYWTTYLYARCNRSVSYATPAYYAHWASQRAKDLSAAGASNEQLQQISREWARENPSKPTMFFL